MVAMRSKVAWLVQENHATVKPSVKRDSSVAPRSKSIIELRNLQIFNWKMPENVSQFLSLEQPCEPRSLDVAFKIAEVEKILGNGLLLRSP